MAQVMIPFFYVWHTHEDAAWVELHGTRPSGPPGLKSTKAPVQTTLFPSTFIHLSPRTTSFLSDMKLYLDAMIAPACARQPRQWNRFAASSMIYHRRDNS
jgi:hypothetical protein